MLRSSHRDMAGHAAKGRVARTFVYRCVKCSEVCLSTVKLAVIAQHGTSPGRKDPRCGGTLKYEETRS